MCGAFELEFSLLEALSLILAYQIMTQKTHVGSSYQFPIDN